MEQINLAWTQWTPKDINAAATAALAHKRKALDAVLAVPDAERTFTNTIAALERSDDVVNDVHQQLQVLLDVHPDADIRNAAQQAFNEIGAALVDMEYDRRLWAAVQAWEARKETPGNESDRKLVDDTLRDMRRMGFALPDEQFNELKRTVIELQKLETEFEKVINDWEDGIEVTREQLAGLPERYIEGLQRKGDRYFVTLEYPDYYPFMKMADDGDARRELATKYFRRGGLANLDRLAQMVRLRQKHAALLGYATHADFRCEPRMAKSATTVKSFLDEIANKLIPASRKELIDLIDLKKRALKLEKHAPILFHEQAYWSYKLLKERYDIDGELLKEYFPLERVLTGMMSVYQDVLGVQFSEVPATTLWHPDAKLFEVRSNDKIIGHFILDLYPRKGKYGHAAALPVSLGRENLDGSRQPNLAVLVCNFPKPTASNPSLLSHSEVETLFHEFGHVCHWMVWNGRWQSQSGACTALDFVEMPSQLFEEWPWERSVLTRITSHYQTSEPMPEEMQEKLITSRHHMEVSFYLWQATNALYDLRIHIQPTNAPVEPLHLAQWHRDMILQYDAIDLPDDAIYPAGWGHMADYDAGYYSYLWTKVYALDMYSKFANSPLDPAIGRTYREKVLAVGASQPELKTIEDFLGRAPSNKAFLKSLGIDTMKS